MAGTMVQYKQLYVAGTGSISIAVDGTTLCWVRLFCSCLTVKDEVGEEGWILGLDKLVAGQK